jgi:hypothetical protein
MVRLLSLLNVSILLLVNGTYSNLLLKLKQDKITGWKNEQDYLLYKSMIHALNILIVTLVLKHLKVVVGAQ